MSSSQSRQGVIFEVGEDGDGAPITRDQSIRSSAGSDIVTRLLFLCLTRGTVDRFD